MIDFLGCRLTKRELKEYIQMLSNYIVVMTFFEQMLNSGDLRIEDYIELEKEFAQKYKISNESIFRMKKEVGDSPNNVIEIKK